MERPKRNWEHYKWRLFYYNPDDPSLFVEKQFGYGLDMNFAHRSAWYLLLFLILFPTLVVVVPILLLR
jgi:uncharacterized membrane protein